MDQVEPTGLPPKFQQLADTLSAQPREVRELVRYALVLAMIDDEKARVIATREEQARTYLRIETIVGNVFEIVKPNLEKAVEHALLQQIREIVRQSDEGGE